VIADKLSNLSAISWQEQVTLNKKITILWGSIDANETFAPKFWKKKYLLH
jgi:hypothetical protein